MVRKRQVRNIGGRDIRSQASFIGRSVAGCRLIRLVLNYFAAFVHTAVTVATESSAAYTLSIKSRTFTLGS